MIHPVRDTILVFALLWLAACSGGGDNSNMTHTGAPPGGSPPPGSSPPSGSNSPPGSNTPPASSPPQPPAQVERFNAPIAAMIPVPNGNGDIYVAGPFTTYNNQPVRPVVRLRPNGTLVDSFKLTDAVTVPGPDGVKFIAAADDGSGDLYLTEGIHVWKVNTAGALASGFTAGEIKFVNRPLTGPDAIIFAMTPAGDGSGRVYVGGVFDTYNQLPTTPLVRLNTSGTTDPTFVSNTGGAWVWTVLPSKDGSGDLYVINYGHTGGPPSSFGPGRLGRLNPDGTIDPAFRGFQGVDGPPYTVTLVEDGSGDLLVAGNFIRISNTLAVPAFIRLNSDGSADEMTPRLSPDGSVDPTSPWPEVTFPSVLVKAADGTNDWFVVTSSGPFDRPLSQLKRHNADGTLDPSFQIGQAEVGIGVILPAPDNTGDLYAAGSFTTYNSVQVGHIVRIHSNGTLVAPSP